MVAPPVFEFIMPPRLAAWSQQALVAFQRERVPAGAPPVRTEDAQRCLVTGEVPERVVRRVYGITDQEVCAAISKKTGSLMNNYVSDVEQLVRSKLKMDLREPDIEDARSSCPVHDEDGRLRMKMRCNMSVQQLQPEALKLDLVRLQQHFHLISAEVKREPGTGKKLRGTGEKSNKDKVERMGAAPALAGGKQTEYCESITVDLRISTAAGQLHLYNVRCLVLEHNDDEVCDDVAEGVAPG
ncbi:hypothetical protein P43SY_010889 [Pythium insidiosum]|uniref:Uncharacterized protein n=1 Tax=Pythium insidiosum TaxID=114742 RepID=A0AAD5Q5V1_PYTIN|nr:hypothetical protein P43SY_010889 [Pythium insidiosum]